MNEQCKACSLIYRESESSRYAYAGLPSEGLYGGLNFRAGYCSAAISYVYMTGDLDQFQRTEFFLSPKSVQLWVILKGSMRVSFPGTNDLMDLSEGTVTLIEEGTGVEGTSLPGHATEAMLLSLDIEFLRKVERSVDDFPGWEKFSKGAMSSRILLLTSLTDVMSQIIRNLAFNEYEGCFKMHLVEMKVMEFLLLALMKELDASEVEKEQVDDLDARLAQQMHAVRDILLDNLADPPSIRQLALRVGTNESHLKRHFKLLFGETVYGFLIQKRMEKALELLKRKDLRISDIAELLGYKHATHFSAAFKKYFGSLPKDYR